MAALEFEKPIRELEQRIKELEAYTREQHVDLSDEIELLRRRLDRMQAETFRNLSRWQKVQVARAPGRPTSLDYIRDCCTDWIELHGDRAYRDDPAIIGGLARWQGRPVVLIAQQKGRDTKENLARNFGMAYPEGYRKAIRLFRLAERFRRPVVTLIDTPGAYPGLGAEERGQAWIIAESIRTMCELTVPVVCVVIGEGGSGGALAIGVGNRVLMLENAVYSVIAPESCAVILWRDVGQAAQAADALKLTAPDLRRFELVDDLIPEPAGGAHRDPKAAASNLQAAVAANLEGMTGTGPGELRRQRYERFRKLGQVQLRTSAPAGSVSPGQAEAGPGRGRA
jgi:acetyl-CoA carboxylase carboxyl transferase subunit alpha